MSQKTFRVNTHNPSLLCVDDEPSILQSIRRNLSHLGHVYKEECPYSALEIIKSGKVDIVITDMKMPGMSSAQLIKAVKQLGFEQPPNFIVITGNADKNELESALNTGLVDRFLYKPWSNLELRQMVEDLLQKRELKHRAYFMEQELKKTESAIR